MREGQADSIEDLTPAEIHSIATSEQAEIVYLSLVGTVATVLNTVVLVKLLRETRTPTARTSFMAGPYHLSSFTLFKLNLCLTDFLILLVHTFGKIIWLSFFNWPWGDTACRVYQLLSIFSFYANSNVVVAIGVDRLKVVYTSHIQGAASVRRVKLMLGLAWLVAFLCSIPQLVIWRTFEVTPRSFQCTNVFEIRRYHNESTNLLANLELSYEMFHQAAVFWIPFVILAVSYLLIVLKLLHFTFRPVHYVMPPKSSTSVSSTSRLLNILDIKQRPESCQFDHLLSTSIAMEPISPRSTASLQEPLRRTVKKKHSVLRKLTSTRLGIDLKGVPLWRKQLRSRVFLTALVVVVAHVAMWLPYNVISTLRFVDYERYALIASNWGAILEDLIVVNSLINPILYSYPCR